jgi:epoxide hydrolase-like predicted phosphatase
MLILSTEIIGICRVACHAAYYRLVTELRAVVIDWGGVLTQPIRDTVRDWIVADQIDWDTYLAVVGPWLNDAYGAESVPPVVRLPEGVEPPEGMEPPDDVEPPGGVRSPANSHSSAFVNPIHALERGECTVAEFEQVLAERLVRTDGKPVPANGLLTRMLSASVPIPAMYQLIRDLRGKGVRTALLSNSWGPDGYPRQDFPDLFDAVVISGEVGMRKPEPRIFLHSAELLGVAPAECVFIDDLEANVKAAIGCGMTGVHHTDPAYTTQRLTELFADR